MPLDVKKKLQESAAKMQKVIDAAKKEKKQ
jgi:hypothetical protein